ncbi:MAG TPA: amino acid permease [Candidatus Acidoferrum sp.]|jgi:APA family basic amino acid/polyamine antiporter
MPPLLRTLRLRDLFLLFIGSVIGSGIFLTPGLILRQLNGSVGFSLLVWIAGGTLSLLGALTYAELAATNPEAGGLYCFIRDGFGRIPAFLYGWCLFLVIASGSVAALARAFTEHLAEVVPLSGVGKTVLSVVMVAVVTAVNVWGTRKSSNLQNWTTLIKVGIIVILSAILLILGSHAGDLTSALGTTQHGVGLLSSFGLAMISVLWAYEGWQFGTYSAGEVVNPQKAFPRAFLMGSLTLAGLYIIAVIAYLVALGPAGATASSTIASTAVGVVLGRRAEIIVAVTILVSTFSAANSVMLTAPRVFYAMANDNLFFKRLAAVHPRFQTPAAAIVALGTWSAVLACAGKFAELIGGVIFIGWIFYGLGAAAIFPLRRAGKDLPIPYRVPGYPWTPLLFVLAAAAIVGNAIVVAFLDPSQFVHLAVAIALFVLGIPAYFFWRKRGVAGL